MNTKKKFCSKCLVAQIAALLVIGGLVVFFFLVLAG